MISEPTRLVPAADFPVVPFDAVDILGELERRPTRPSRLIDEHHAFTLLAAEMAANPRNMLQKLVELAVELTGAHTAGISLLEGSVFRWEAVAGVFAGARGGTMPRQQSPCGVCIDRNATQLMHLPDRCFPALPAEPRFVETMLIPFHGQGVPIGTMWLVSHSDDRKFDREDERFVSQLSQFASAGWQMLRSSDQLAATNRRKDDFLAMLGDELRNPLGAISTATSLARHRLQGDAIATTAIDMIAWQSQHLQRLAEDLLDIARIESGKLQLHRTPIDARAVVINAVAALRSQIEGRHHSLKLDLGDDPVVIEGDATRLVQVVSNLVGNAAKYTPVNGKLSVSVAKEGGQVVVTVRDNGDGIPNDRALQIFEPFSQLAHARRTSTGGLGLGLALVKSLTEMHGGTVSVASDGANLGSCFSIRLPIVAAELSAGQDEWFVRPRRDRRDANRLH